MKIWSEESTFKSISQCTCPRCHTGRMFVKGKLTKPGSLFIMNKSCEHCNQSFEPEPGYYFGAMFISYAINTALFISIWVLLELIYPSYSLTLLLSLIIVSAILLFPYIFRVSRSMWIAIFIPYKGGKQELKESS